MLKLFTWPFHVLIDFFRGIFLLGRKACLWIGFILFTVVFVGSLLFFFLALTDHRTADVSLIALGGAFDCIFWLMPWWLIIVFAVALIYLWYRHVVIGSVIAGVVLAIAVLVFLKGV